MASPGGCRARHFWAGALSGLALTTAACTEAPASIEMRPAERMLGVIGASARMGARRVASDGYLLGGSYAYPEHFNWASDAPGVATVDSLGFVIAVGEGTAKISATSSGVTGTATVTVVDAARLAWSIPLGGPVNAGPVVSRDGTIYVSPPGALVAVDPYGRRLWSVATGWGARSTPTIGQDGTIYVTTENPGTSLLAVDRSGVIRWTVEGIGGVASSPTLGEDGTVYVAAHDSTLYAVDSAGRTLWTFRAPAAFGLSSPAIARDGTVVVGAEDGRLYAVGEDGLERWTFETGGVIRSSPAIARDGTIYFGSVDGHLYALDEQGGQRWALDLGEEIWSSPAIGSDGTVYVGATGIHAVDHSGRLRWRSEGTFPPTRVLSAPLLSDDGSIYFGGLDRRVWALSADGSEKWDYPTGGLVVAPPALGLDGTILVASYDGILYAIRERDLEKGG